MDSEKEEYYDDEGEGEDEGAYGGGAGRGAARVPHMPEVSITVMRPSGETLRARQGIQQIASKDCLVCGRSYRYSHNARRHELGAHGFDRYTSRPAPRPRAKLRPNPFNPKARMMPAPAARGALLPKVGPPRVAPQRIAAPPRPIPIRTPKVPQNDLPYPLRIKALKDLQIKKKEPQILKTLLTAKPEILVSEPEIPNSGPESPETLISEPEIASFQVETILSEPDGFVGRPVDDGDDDDDRGPHYDTVDMESDNEIEIARQRERADDAEENHADDYAEDTARDENPLEENRVDDEKEPGEENGDSQDASVDNLEPEVEIGVKEDDERGDGDDEREVAHDDAYNEDDDMPMAIAPVVEINEDLQTNSYNSEGHYEEDLDETVDPTDAVDGDEPVKDLDPDKVYITKTQRDFILKYRDIIQQINTMRCLCCDKEHPRRKAVIQHLQKNGHKVPKHTCYNCVVTFGHIGALLSHMRSNTCTDLWKIIYNENGITDDIVLENEPKETKVQYKDVLNSRSYACKLCPAKFQLKQFIMKHVLDVHEDGQSRVPHACVHCGLRFKEKSVAKRHIRNGDCTVYISCDLCSDKFLNVHEFNEHALAAHAGTYDPDNQNKCIDGRPSDCPVCGKKNTSYPNLVKHLKAVHNEERPHYCQHCDAKFEQAADLNKHIYVQHSDRTLGAAEPDALVKEEAEEYHYSCTECNAIFETVDAWTDHQVAEHNQVAHHCDQCDKKFLRPSELAEHKNTHLRVKFYPCGACPDSYGTPQKLAEHVARAHGPGRPDQEFFCDICVRSFKSRQAYSNHMRIHAKVPTTNRKPGEARGFAPQIVGKPIRQFAMQPGFSPFVPNAPYCCDICGKGFMHKKNIWKHKKVLHADLLADRADSEDNTMHASTEDDEGAPDENGAVLSTPQFNSFTFAGLAAGGAGPDPLPYSCELCYKRFPLRTSLWKHKRAKHGLSGGEEGGRSSCTICKITFADKKSYYRHRKNVHKSSVQMCKICGKPLASTGELYEHLKAAHARELLGYDGAAKREPHEPDEYDGDHDSADAGADYQARYPCDQCGKQFVGLLALQNHQCVSRAPQPQTFDCEICHKSYTSIAALKSHRGWHLRSPDGKAAANNSGLWMPQNKVTAKVSKHEVLEPPPPARPPAPAKRRLPPEVEVTVVNPNKKLRSDDSLETEQAGAEDRYCNLCDKEFTKRAAYQRHMDEVHQPNSVFCPVCDKSFTRKSTLIVHMKKHYEGGGDAHDARDSPDAADGDDAPACDVCGESFEAGAALAAHKRAAHAEDSGESEESRGAGEFTCAQCGAGVGTPRELLAHRAAHATPSKFYCDACKLYFARALDLSAHTRARHRDDDKAFFPCAMCDRFYANKKSLQRHIEAVH